MLEVQCGTRSYYLQRTERQPQCFYASFGRYQQLFMLCIELSKSFLPPKTDPMILVCTKVRPTIILCTGVRIPSHRGSTAEWAASAKFTTALLSDQGRQVYANDKAGGVPARCAVGENPSAAVSLCRLSSVWKGTC